MLRNFHEWSNAIPSFLNNVLSRRAHSLRAAGGCLWNNERVSNYEFLKGNGRNGYYFVEQVVCVYRSTGIKILGQVCDKENWKNLSSKMCTYRVSGNTISDRYFENGSRDRNFNKIIYRRFP